MLDLPAPLLNFGSKIINTTAGITLVLQFLSETACEASVIVLITFDSF